MTRGNDRPMTGALPGGGGKSRKALVAFCFPIPVFFFERTAIPVQRGANGHKDPTHCRPGAGASTSPGKGEGAAVPAPGRSAPSEARLGVEGDTCTRYRRACHGRPAQPWDPTCPPPPPAPPKRPTCTGTAISAACSWAPGISAQPEPVVSGARVAEISWPAKCQFGTIWVCRREHPSVIHDFKPNPPPIFQQAKSTQICAPRKRKHFCASCARGLPRSSGRDGP